MTHCISGPIAFGGDPFCKMVDADVMDVIGIVRVDWKFLEVDAMPDRDVPVGKRTLLGWLDYKVGQFYPCTDRVQVAVGDLRKFSGRFCWEQLFQWDRYPWGRVCLSF